MAAAVPSLVVRIGADISRLTSGLRTASNSVNQFAQRNQEAFHAVGAVGTALTGVGIAAVGGLGIAVKTAANFESAMSRVAALSGASDAELIKLTDTAKELGATTSFSATQAAEGMQYLAMAGFKTNDVIAAMPGLLAMAAAGQTELGETADIASNILTGFGLKADETARVADVLTKAFTNSNTDLNMLGQTMKYVAPVAKASGQSLESMAASAGILGNAGIQADQAGTSLRMMLIRLAKPPRMAKDALDQLGISVSDEQGNMKDLSVVIGEMAEATKDMTEADRLAAVAKISGVEASAAMLALMDAGQDTIESFTKELENSGGTAEKIAAKQLDNLKGQLIILKSALEGAAIAIGNALLPALKVITKWLQKAVDWFNGLSKTTKTLIVIGTALATVFALLLGPILILVGFLPAIAAGFAAISAAMPAVIGAIAAVAAPIALVVGGIIALVAAFKWLYKNVEWFATSVDFVMRKTKESFASFIEVAKVGLEGIKRFFKDVGSFMRAFLNGDWTQAKELFVKIFTNAWESLKKLGGKFISEIKKLWGDEFNKLVEIISEFRKKALDKLAEWRKAFAEWSAGLWSATVDGFNSWWTSVADWFTQKSTDMRALLDGWGETIVDWFKALPSKVGGKLNAWWTSISGWFTKKSTDMRSLLDGWGEAAIAWIKELPSKAMEGLGKFAETLKQWTMSQHQENVRQFTEWGNAILEWFTTMPERMSEKLSAWGEAILNWFNEVPAQTIESMMAWRESVLGWFEEVRVGMLEKLTGWGDSIMTWFSEIPGRISEAFTVWWATITGWFDTTKESITTKLGEWWAAISTWFSTRPAEIYAQLGVWWEKISLWFSEIPARITAKLGEWWTAIKTWFSSIPNKPEIKDSGKKMVDKLAEGNNEKKPEFMDKLGKIIVDVALGALAFAGVALIAAGREIVKRFIDGIKQIDLKQTGRDMVNGLIGGIGEMVSSVANKAKELAIAAKNSVESWLDISSPSRVFKKLGVHTGEGFVLGMDSMISDVEKASGRLADAAIVDAPDLSTSFSTPSAAGAGVMAGLSVDHTNSSSDNAVSIMQQALQMMSGMQVVMDGERVGTLVAPTVNRELAKDNATTTRRKGQRR